MKNIPHFLIMAIILSLFALYLVTKGLDKETHRLDTRVEQVDDRIDELESALERRLGEL